MKFKSMKNNNSLVFILVSIITAIIIGIIFFKLDYIENEGFNPTDDGVILAQAFRLINGEIPHNDFISIRPVFSGILHSIHFFSPLPMQVSARWFVVFQYFVYSFIWVIILFRTFNFHLNSFYKLIIYFVSVGLLSFILNVNNYNLYPWTTIDAVFLSTISFAFFITLFNQDISRIKMAFFMILGLIFISLAAISRQNFLLPAILMFIIVNVHYIRKKRLAELPVICIIGALPFIIYFFYLLTNDALSYFIDQMTGRTELFETGILRYLKEFLKADLLIINFVLLTGIFYFWVKLPKISKDVASLRLIPLVIFNDKQKKIELAILLFYFAAFVFFSFYMFFVKSEMLFKTPFEMFWILFVVTILGAMNIKFSNKQVAVLGFSLFIAWTSSISLGDNTPIFTTGIIGSTIVVLIIYLIKKIISEKFKKSAEHIILISSIPLIISLFIVSIYGQRKINYRDKESSYLTHCLGDIFDEFGNIKTNPATYEYYIDFMNIYTNYDDIKNNFVLLPNNAIIYPLLKSKNPFPLDWMSHSEYIGSEYLLYRKLNDILEKKSIYVIIDKYNSKDIAYELIQMNYDIYRYDYMKLIQNKCEELPCESKYFKLFRNKKNL